MSDLKIRQELRRRGILTNGYPDDELWSEPPKTYTVALSEDFLPVAEATQPEFGGHTDKFRARYWCTLFGLTSNNLNKPCRPGTEN